MALSKEMVPVAVTIDKSLREDWDYDQSVEKISKVFARYKKMTEELLNELWLAKQVLTDGGTRTAGRTKKGEQSWSNYVEECFPDGLFCKKTIDMHLRYYFEGGSEETSKSTISSSEKSDPITDHSKLKIEEQKKMDDGRIYLKIFLPEKKKFHEQYIKA